MATKIDLIKLHHPEAPKILIEPPGPRAKELLEKQKKFEGNPVLYLV